MTGPATGFLGLSHLGLVSSIGWASLGDPVVAVDLDGGRVAELQRGTLPILEPSLETLFGRSRARMTFASDPAALGECPLVIIAYDVPTDALNRSDTAVVLDLVDAALPHLRPGVTLALMSQVPTGFTRQLADRIRMRRPDLVFTLYYWVETLIVGNAVARYLTPERIMLGCRDPAAPLPRKLDAGLRRFGCPVLTMRYESAELAKTAINLYLTASVTYANTLADLCEAVGADWSEIVPALRLDARIGPAAYLAPSLGVAGGNLERDLVTLHRLARELGVDAAFVDTLVDYNGRRLRWLMDRLRLHVFSATALPTLAVWGLTYKKNTRATRNSPALRTIAGLSGRARFRAWDPVIRAGDVDIAAEVCASRDAALDGADALLIMADWDEFASADVIAIQKAMRRPIVIDCVGALRARSAELSGITYLGMGR
ncbi:MAG: nucleotide sugar dehydrogenase [Candidatus Rokuibacteriota bacterium]